MKQKVLLLLFLVLCSACGSVRTFETTTVRVRGHVGEAHEELAIARQTLKGIQKQNAEFEKTIAKLEMFSEKSMHSETQCLEIARIRGVLPPVKKK